MVLGLIDFLLGGKKKNKVPKTGQVATPNTGNVNSATPAPASDGTTLPDGATKPTDNAQEMNFEDSNDSADNTIEATETPNTTQKVESNVSPAPVRASNPSESAAPGQKKSISEVIGKLNSELKESSDRLTTLVTDFKTLENNVNEMGHKVDELEEGKKVTDEKLAQMDENMTKFLSLYELINNQYNPFIDKDDLMKPIQKPVMVDSSGNSISSNPAEISKPSHLDLEKALGEDAKKMVVASSQDFDSIMLELDTLDIEQAAGDSVPLKTLKNNTNSLVIILSWLEYLIKRVGMEETRSSLRYYTEVLRWVTPEVYFELDKYLKGMKDKNTTRDGSESLDVKDHIVSLYFISKLNEKSLDEKLTKAVLQIIKQ